MSCSKLVKAMSMIMSAHGRKDNEGGDDGDVNEGNTGNEGGMVNEGDEGSEGDGQGIGCNA